MSILELPDEILYHLLTNIALSCKRLRALAMDGPLRRHILLIRNSARLSVSLLSRPSRDTLAKQNILRGVHIHQHIQQGQYIGGASSVRSYHVLCRLERQMVSIRIAKKLKARPNWTELVERGVLPEEMFVMQEEFETKRRWKMYQQQQLHLLQKQHLLPQMQQGEQEQKENRLEKHNEIMEQSDLQYTSMQIDESHSLEADSNSNLLFLTPSQPSFQSHRESNPHVTISSSPTTSIQQTQRRKKSLSNALIPKIELLRKAMDRDRLSRLVQRRPSPSELNQSPKTATVLHAYHLIAYSSTSKDLVPLTSQLNFFLKGERLSHWLYHQRPSLAVVLNERNMLKTEARTAWMVCPGVAKKVRFYEGLIQESRNHEQQLHDFFMNHQPQQQQQLQQQPQRPSHQPQPGFPPIAVS
ncbi:hypothetical protein FBU30_004199 [Linnemannia zychae]|nr:hypothetical protein FBU30_004199 [Linnemannia zychae]